MQKKSLRIEFKYLEEVNKEDVLALMNNPLVLRQMPLAKESFDDDAMKSFSQPKSNCGAITGMAHGRLLSMGNLQAGEASNMNTEILTLPWCSIQIIGASAGTSMKRSSSGLLVKWDLNRSPFYSLLRENPLKRFCATISNPMEKLK